ncbi:MAG: hypothetical protein WCO56_19540 [Verrucomicrobiota bacterium]
MKTIPLDAVQTVLAGIIRQNAEQSESRVDVLAAKQPFVRAYLLAVDEVIGKESRGRLLMTGTMIWDVMAARQPDLRQVTELELRQAHERNQQWIKEILQGATEADQLSRIRTAWDGYNQVPLLGLVYAALQAHQEESETPTPGNAETELMYLKTVIDCLDQ